VTPLPVAVPTNISVSLEEPLVRVTVSVTEPEPMTDELGGETVNPVGGASVVRFTCWLGALRDGTVKPELGLVPEGRLAGVGLSREVTLKRKLALLPEGRLAEVGLTLNWNGLTCMGTHSWRGRKVTLGMTFVTTPVAVTTLP